MTTDSTSPNGTPDAGSPDERAPAAEGAGLLIPDALAPETEVADVPYQVLARKWRPQSFAQVVGQAAIVRTLSNALDQGRIAHAYCFSGIRGVGKTTVARLLAKGLNCRTASAPTSDPCGKCDACVEIEESRNLDVVEMDAASQTGVDDIRQLNEFARYTPSRDRYRVFIVDEAHMLSNQAFNALLKTLEEPPPHVVFMLATTEPHKILQTVLSRCQHYHLGRISQGDIKSRLREIAAAEGVSVSDDALSLVASAADGSMRDAQSLLDKLIAFAGTSIDDETVVDLLGMVDRELLYQVIDLIASEDLNGVLGLVDTLIEQGVDLHQFTLDLLGHLRGLLIARTVEKPATILHLPDGDIARMREQAMRFELDDIDRAFSLLAASEYRIKQSEVPRYHVEMVLGRLARMPHLTPIADLVSELRGPPRAPGGSNASGSGGSRSGTGGAGPTPHETGQSRNGASDAAGGPGLAGGTPRESDPPGSRAYGFDDRPLRAPGAAAAPVSATADSGPAPMPISAREEVPAPEPLPAPEPVPAPEPAPAPGPVPAPDPPSEPEPVPAAEPEPAPGPQAAIDGPRVDAEVGLILQQLRDSKPMIAQVLARAETIEIKDDVLSISFPANRALFKDRLNDKDSLAVIEEAAKAALGRSVRVMTRLASADSAPASQPSATSRPASRGEPTPRSQPTPRSRPLRATPAEPTGAEEAARKKLWQRAEEEPLVSRFIEELGGQLTEVEDI